MAYITADEVPTEVVCRALFIPNNPQFIANVLGAIQELTFAYNFVSEGGISPEDMAEAYKPMFDALCFSEGPCRMIGEIIAYAGPTSPNPKWLLCDGSSLLRVDYPDLFDVIGTTYGATDSTHFSLPDLLGRVPIGSGTGTGLPTYALGDSFGEVEHTLIEAEMPSHTHTTGNSLLLGTSAPPPFDALGPNPIPAVTGSTGGDGAHNNMQPSLAINYLIVATNE